VRLVLVPALADAAVGLDVAVLVLVEPPALVAITTATSTNRERREA